MSNIRHWFTADEHYSHFKILEYCNRPFKTLEKMDETIIKNHNRVVGENDVVYHIGDFTLEKDVERVNNYIRRLNGKHIFIKGSHDYWMDDGFPRMLEIEIEKQFIVLCHYAMRVWPKSHYNSWQFFGHSHGKLEGVGKQLDVGVDTCYDGHKSFYPYSFEEIKKIMKKRKDNFNRIIK